MSSDAKSLSTDLTGWTLGEKKLIKDGQTAQWSGCTDKLKKLGMTLDVDMPQLLKSTTLTTPTDQYGDRKKVREYAGEVFNKFLPAFVDSVVAFCSNADYKEALSEAVKKVVLSFQNDGMDTGSTENRLGTFEIKDKVFTAKFGPYNSTVGGWQSDMDANMKKFLEGAL